MTLASSAASSTAPAADHAPEQTGLASRLQGHVNALASRIGERKAFLPQALHAAADYIRAQWVSQRYRVAIQSYEAFEVRSENLEITLPGIDQPDEILLIGAHYDSVQGSPGANDNASDSDMQARQHLHVAP